MNNTRSIAVCLVLVIVLALLGEWVGASIMFLLACMQTYREYRIRRMLYTHWELRQDAEGATWDSRNKREIKYPYK